MILLTECKSQELSSYLWKSCGGGGLAKNTQPLNSAAGENNRGCLVEQDVAATKAYHKGIQSDKDSWSCTPNTLTNLPSVPLSQESTNLLMLHI